MDCASGSVARVRASLITTLFASGSQFASSGEALSGKATKFVAPSGRRPKDTPGCAFVYVITSTVESVLLKTR